MKFLIRNNIHEFHEMLIVTNSTQGSMNFLLTSGRSSRGSAFPWSIRIVEGPGSAGVPSESRLPWEGKGKGNAVCHHPWGHHADGR